MSSVGQREARTQQSVLQFFQAALGYEYLGHWQDREGNSNVEQDLLANWLTRQGHSDKIIRKVLFELDQAAAVSGSTSLYDANRTVYGLLRYGVKVQPGPGQPHLTVHLVDWDTPSNNAFAVAEEVTVVGPNTKRPDVVLYVNGIAVGVLELKRSTVSVGDGIRQTLDNQKPEFIRPFFSTVQLVLAGNTTEGLRYAVIETPEKYWLHWKEPGGEGDDLPDPLLKGLYQLCRPERLLEILHDFMVFDAGIKKTCRHNQYFGVRAAQDFVQRREGGILWHTQGSGKSLIMVWLAKWIRENVQDGRVVIITDRTELDEQIEKVFLGVDEAIYRTSSGADLISVLENNTEWLVCSLMQKFGASEEGDVDAFIQDVQRHRQAGFQAKGEVFVFIDEAHRTQSGKLHRAMKELLPNATLIGFTGTPLLKKDKRKSIEVFGRYIHTYKYDEAVRDRVVLDLRYEARDIDQNLTSQDRVDEWFDAKTQGLTDYAKAKLKERWGTLRQVLSSQDRLAKIVNDILLDMERRNRLKSGHGNALLVCGSIYQACRTYEMFQQAGFKECAIITSYKPSANSIKGEETGEGQTEKLLQYEIYRKMLARHFGEDEDAAVTKVEQFEKDVKKRFIEQPGQMKLLIVVDKLLTGFDAPPATYLYIDKPMRDHGLFQAICRVNRLDTPDKEYGYIVDYRDLFKSLERSIKDYTGEAFDGFDADDVAGLLKDRLQQGRERLEELREEIKALVEPVAPPQGTDECIHYFCGPDTTDPEGLKETEPRRAKLYDVVGSLVRAYANLANEMEAAGYTPGEAAKVKDEVRHFDDVRREVMLASSDYIDLKRYEPGMRHLLDSYIRAEDSKVVSAFDDMTLVDLIVRDGEKAVDALPPGLKGSRDAVAETIENNVRTVIIDEHDANPAYYAKMSELLDTLILQRRQQAIEYAAYLAKIVELAKQVKQGPGGDSYPASLHTNAQRALYDNLDQAEDLAHAVDEAVRTTKEDGWRGHRLKERKVLFAIRHILGDDDERVDRVFELVKNQRDY